MADRFPRPVEAERFLERRINTPTVNWDDLKWGEHAHAFTAAHSCEANILDDIHGLLNKAMSAGGSYQAFRDGMLDAMDKAGWYGGNGHTKDDKDYINWRIKIIYDTNMRTAYAAARYRRQLQDADSRPVWVYLSKLVGANRRPEHLGLHGKAFRYDDPFWDTYYPPNGWGCECSVTTKSESGAKRAGITVEDSETMNLPEIDPTWSYNPGREALAPNFNKFTALPKDIVKEAQAAYSRDMQNTRMTEGEFNTLLRRASEPDFKSLNIMYQVGTLEERRFTALQKTGVRDAKVMAGDKQLWHGTGDKVNRQKISERLFNELYNQLQEPETIYEENVKNKFYRVFHFVKDTKDGKKLKILLHLTKLKDTAIALQVRTMGHANYQYADKNLFREIKW
jgi:SPP1 gp7 family putative phage head morphogenesis protein